MKKIILPILGLLSFVTIEAQTLQTAYFSEDFTYSYRLNPAFHPDYSFVGLPFIGITSGAYRGDFSLGDFFYRTGGETVTFMNDALPSSDFLRNFKSGMNKFNTEAYTNLASIGFTSGGLYNIVDVNIRSYGSGKVPFDLPRFLKEGASIDGTYNLSGLNARSTTFFEIGISSSWKATRKLTIGMRFKGVIGFVNSYIDMDQLSITHSGDSWTVNSAGVIASAYDGYRIASKPSYHDPSVELIDLANTKIGKPRGIMNGYGVGADVGMWYDDSSWLFSASVSDIGCVFWFHNLYGHSPAATKTYEAAYTHHTHRGGTFVNELSDMGALLADALNFEKEDEFQTLGLLPVTVRLGAKYLYLSDISFGGLATFRYDDICPFWDVRGSINFQPVRHVELIGSVGYGTLGATVGAFVNAHVGFVNMFAGTDNLIGTSGSTFFPSSKGIPNFVGGVNLTW